jgi:hypothetical protein
MKPKTNTRVKGGEGSRESANIKRKSLGVTCDPPPPTPQPVNRWVFLTHLHKRHAPAFREKKTIEYCRDQDFEK